MHDKPNLDDCSTLHNLWPQHPNFIFYRRQGRPTVQMLDLILPFPNVYMFMSSVQQPDLAQHNKKSRENEWFLSKTNYIKYIKTLFIFLKQIFVIFYENLRQSLIEDISPCAINIIFWGAHIVPEPIFDSILISIVIYF